MKRKKDNNIITGYQNQYIEIMASANIASPYGGTDPNNTVYWATTAQVDSIKAWRRTEGNQSSLELAYQFRVRYRNDRNIQNNMLLKWRGLYFTIFDYQPDLVYQDFVVFKGIQTNPGNLVITT